jgi:AcrR family transcriptional regulator
VASSASPTRQPRKRAKRDLILGAARQIVSEVGFHDASIAAVAAASGVSTGSIYSYFASKAELMAEVVAVVSERELAVLSEIVAGSGTVQERLTAGVNVFAKRAFRNRRLAWSMIAEPADPAVDATRLEYRRALAQQFEKLIREGIKSGAFRKVDVEAAAAVIVGGFMEALVGPLSPERSIAEGRAEEIATALADLALHAVKKNAQENAR